MGEATQDRDLLLPYRHIGDYEPVDLSRLRPKDSYRRLFEKRTHAIDELVAKHGRIPPELLVPRSCPTCGARDGRPEIDKDHLTIVRCPSCDTVYVSPAFDEAHYLAVYGSPAYQEIMRDLGEASHLYRVERFGTERVSTMARYLAPDAGPCPEYLDVGCSTGFVVEAARRLGWRARGIDLNPSAVEFGRRRGLDLQTVALSESGLDGGSLDAVSLFDVLEHLFDPSETLRQCVAALRPGGILYIYVPNYDSASRLLMGKDAHFIWPTHHLTYYTPMTARTFLERHGLRVELVQTEGLDIADYVWQRQEVFGEDMTVLERVADTMQFLANAGGYGKNLRVLARRVA
ncbi:MAG: class I SAM-dependent methyltransferase [Acidobacteriota bacterium]